MKLKRAIEIKMQGKGSIQGIFNRGILYTRTCKEINEDYLKFKENLPKGTPYWVRSYFDGVRDCLSDMIYNHLHFAYVVNDKLCSVHKENPLHYEKHGFTPSDLIDKPGGHYWIKNNKPFFTQEDV